MKAAARVNFEQSLGLGMRKVYLNPSHSWCQLKPLPQAANFLGPPTSIHLLSSAHLPPPPTPWSGIGRGDKCGGEQWARLSEEQKLPLCEVRGGTFGLLPHMLRGLVWPWIYQYGSRLAVAVFCGMMEFAIPCWYLALLLRDYCTYSLNDVSLAWTNISEFNRGHTAIILSDLFLRMRLEWVGTCISERYHFRFQVGNTTLECFLTWNEFLQFET